MGGVMKNRILFLSCTLYLEPYNLSLVPYNLSCFITGVTHD